MWTATVSFNQTVRQMTEMFEWPNYLCKKWPECLSEKNPDLRTHDLAYICLQQRLV